MDFTYLKEFMDMMARERTPGCAVQVYLGGERVFRYEAGYADLDSKEVLHGTEHFNVYSCSKVATCTAGAQLLEQGKFLLTDPLYEYMPEFRHMSVKQANGALTEAQNPITVGDLFSMTAGFNYASDAPYIEKAHAATNGKMDTRTVIRMLAEEPLDFEPGTRWQYSMCHDVLACLVEVVSGKKFRDYMDANIFDPLSMNRTVYHHTPTISDNLATLYRFEPYDSDGNLDDAKTQKSGNARDGHFIKVSKIPSFVFGSEYDSGGAGIATTISDYVKLLAALANKGKGLSGERILSPNTVELMKTNRLTEEQRKYMDWKQLIGYGYGLGVRTCIEKAQGGHTCNIGEFGWGGAAGSECIIDSEINLAVFFAQHCLNPCGDWYMTRLKNIIYTCLSS